MERAIALGEVDTFNFYLAETFHMLPREVRELPNLDVVELAAFYTYKHAMQAHANDVAEMRANHG